MLSGVEMGASKQERGAVKRTLVAFALVSCLWAAPVPAGPFEDGMAAAKQGEFAAALRLLRPLAEQGHADAQFYLGVMYSNAQGVRLDPAEALAWFRAAGMQGHLEAQYSVAVFYEKGYGVEQNYKEAAKWYRLSALGGFPDGQSALAYLYANGNGVPKNSSEALKWVTRAAEQGYPTAQFNLGMFHYRRTGVFQNLVEAYKWFALAANGSAGKERDSASKHRDEVAKKMTEAQISNARRTIAEWKPKAWNAKMPSIELHRLSDRNSILGSTKPVNEPLTASEMDDVRKQIQGCWKSPTTKRGEWDFTVEIDLVLNRDGTITESTITDMALARRDDVFRAAAENAVRVLNSAPCNPLKLPPAKHEAWQRFSVRFDLRDLL